MKQKIIYLAILAFTFATQAMAQGFTLQGRVTDQDNNPVRTRHRLRAQARKSGIYLLKR